MYIALFSIVLNCINFFHFQFVLIVVCIAVAVLTTTATAADSTPEPAAIQPPPGFDDGFNGPKVQRDPNNKGVHDPAPLKVNF